jgi:hypothetical protein
VEVPKGPECLQARPLKATSRRWHSTPAWDGLHPRRYPRDRSRRSPQFWRRATPACLALAGPSGIGGKSSTRRTLAARSSSGRRRVVERPRKPAPPTLTAVFDVRSLPQPARSTISGSRREALAADVQVVRSPSFTGWPEGNP